MIFTKKLDTVGESAELFENDIGSERTVNMLKQCIEELKHKPSNNTNVEAVLDKFYVVTATSGDTTFWLSQPVRLVKTRYQRSLYQRYFTVNPDTGERPTKTYLHERLQLSQVLELPIQNNPGAEISEKNTFMDKLEYAHKALSGLRDHADHTFSIFPKHDAISNVNALKGWLRRLDSPSADVAVKTVEAVSLLDILKQTK